MAKKPTPEVISDQSNAPEAPPTVEIQIKVEGPVAIVKRILAEQRALDPNVSRATVIKACTDAGINLHTAKTQYQRHYRTV